MYVWNGFTIVGKRADFTESLLVTIETAEEQLRRDPSEWMVPVLSCSAFKTEVGGALNARGPLLSRPVRAPPR